jgi:A/G-specific adenine glycosylase
VSDFPGNELLDWYGQHKRQLPWRETDDPYRIWVSEIMLQQTRVDTVIPYYQRFIKAFPDVYQLAEADRQTLLKLWEGLGYYSRARNLQDAARTVVKEFNGDIPSSFNDIISLKGIGPYTAAAILSIAFAKPYAVVDGNVIRVLTRYCGIQDDIRSQSTKNQIQEIADKFLNKTKPGDFNQAIMELGATVCTPNKPMCGNCPLSSGCIANVTASTDMIPYKTPAKKIPHHHIGVGIIRNHDNRLLIALRPEDGMLGGLWEFPGGKKEKGESIDHTIKRELKEELGVNVMVLDKFMDLKHTYSHFKITLHAYWCRLEPENQTPIPKSSQEIRWVQPSRLNEYPFPKANKVLTEQLQKLDF